MVGLPGCGKSTWAGAQGWNPLSSDAMRILLSDDVANQKIHGRVFATLRYLLRQRLRTGCLLSCVDATHLTRAERRPYFSLARWHKAQLEAVFLDVPISLALTRNRRRGRKVPEEAIFTMAARLEPPTLEEGFHSVVRL